MALTLGRWFAVVAVLCVVAATLILREPDARGPGARTERPREALAASHHAALRRLTHAAATLRVLEVRDSVAAVISGSAAADTGRVFVDRSLPAGHVTALTRAFHRATAQSPTPPRWRVDVALVRDSTTSVRGAARARTEYLATDYVLPGDSSKSCVVIVRLRMRGTENAQMLRWFTSAESVEAMASSMLGPCGFFQRFGPPGPAVAEWLADGGWIHSFVSASDESNDQYWAAAPGTMLDGWPLRVHTTPEGYRCIVGDEKQCRRLVVSESDDNRSDVRTIDGIVTGSSLSASRASWRLGHDLGPHGPRLLDEMAQTLGPERFGAFWTSSLPPADAFAAAAGEDIGAWTAAWARRSYGEHGRGPGLNTGGTLLGMALAGAALTVAMGLRRRRQVA